MCYVQPPHPRRVVAFLNKVLYNIYLCLMASNKQQSYWEEVKKSTAKFKN